MDDLRVLSIQSHVVHGYVGNRCVVFALQQFGAEVDSINSVQYCGHVNYTHCTGQAHKADDFRKVFSGILNNKLHKTYSHLVTGYCASASYLSAVLEAVKQLKAENPDLFYLCDPIMGDEGRMYVDADCAKVYRELVPLADLVTPNQFEMELLTGTQITDEDSALKSVCNLHDQGVRFVCLSSTDFGASSSARKVIRTKADLANYSLAPRAFLTGYFSMRPSSDKQQADLSFRFRVPKIPAYFCGTGDLFSALLLARLSDLEFRQPAFRDVVRNGVVLDEASRHQLAVAVGDALRRAICAVYSVLRTTLERAKSKVKLDDAGQQLSELLELRIVACRDQLTTPLLIDEITVDQLQ